MHVMFAVVAGLAASYLGIRFSLARLFPKDSA
jgi:hypothetical protein